MFSQDYGVRVDFLALRSRAISGEVARVARDEDVGLILVGAVPHIGASAGRAQVFSETIENLLRRAHCRVIVTSFPPGTASVGPRRSPATSGRSGPARLRSPEARRSSARKRRPVARPDRLADDLRRGRRCAPARAAAAGRARRDEQRRDAHDDVQRAQRHDVGEQARARRADGHRRDRDRAAGDADARLQVRRRVALALADRRREADPLRQAEHDPDRRAPPRRPSRPPARAPRAR